MNAIKTVQRTILPLAVMLMASVAYALTPQTGADFLRIGAGARAVGMGSAFTAVADDASAIYWNPAGLAMMFNPQVGFTQSQWLLGTTYNFLGYAQPTRYGSFGLGLTRLADGQIDGRGADRSQTDRFTAADTAYALGYAHELGSALRFGGSVKYISSQIGSDSASTFAMDIGAMKALDSLPVMFGVAVQNVGPGLRFLSQTDALPLAVTGGAALGIAGTLRLAADVKYEPYDHQTSIGLGTEYTLFSAVSLRAGYTTFAAQNLANQGLANSPPAGLGGGLGLRLDRYSADYTITPFGQLGNVQQLSVGVKFGASPKNLKSSDQEVLSPTKDLSPFIR